MTTTRPAMVRVHDVTVRFGARTVLHNTHLHVASGEIVAVLGASGSGKSTLLRVIAGLVTPDAGQIWIDGVDMTTRPTHRRGVGVVFQDEQLFPHLDVAANVGFGLRQQRVPRGESAHRVSQLLALVGLTGFDHRQVTDLSGGEAKRVALARALAPQPQVVLLDEPLTGLDVDLHDRLMTEVAALLHSLSMTAVLVTHDPAEAAAIADRVVRLDSLQPHPS